MNTHLRVAFHVPDGKLTQDNLDDALECVQRMACQQNKGNRPIFLLLDTRTVRLGSDMTTNDHEMDFVIRLWNEPSIKEIA